VCDAGLDHFGVEPVDFGWDCGGSAGWDDEDGAPGADLVHRGVIGGSHGGRSELRVAQCHFGGDVAEQRHQRGQ